LLWSCCVLFFFQAEDGIRDRNVTGVQTCALPISALIVILSGSGIALFFAMIPLIVPLADAAGISPIAVSVPMGLAGNLFRAVSPVAAVVLIVAGTLKVNPLNIIKRTAVPMISGVIFMFVLSMIIFL